MCIFSPFPLIVSRKKPAVQGSWASLGKADETQPLVTLIQTHLSSATFWGWPLGIFSIHCGRAHFLRGAVSAEGLWGEEGKPCLSRSFAPPHPQEGRTSRLCGENRTASLLASRLRFWAAEAVLEVEDGVLGSGGHEFVDRPTAWARRVGPGALGRGVQPGAHLKAFLHLCLCK